MKKQIEIEDLNFSFSGNPILKGVNASVNEGEVVALVGANGSGKSTLMKCMSKIYLNYDGNIKLSGQDLRKMSSIDVSKEIAYVPQHEIKVSGVKVFDMVLSGRMPYMGWRPSEGDYQVVAEVMDSLGISFLAMKDFSELSGGQQQMVYVARAIVQETPIILLDEPTNNLDIKHQIEIMELLKSLSESQNKTIIITIHDINLALQYCTKYMLLKSGKIINQGGKEVINEQNLKALYDVNIKIINNGDDFFVMPYKAK